MRCAGYNEEYLMSKLLEPKYTLFDNIEEMLALDTLSELLSRSVTRVACQPMDGHSGVAGGRLSYVNTNLGRFVIKQMSIDSDWIMFASADEQCRAVRLWEYGLLDQLRPHLEHKIIACARDENGGAILMHDLTGHVYTWGESMTPELVPVFLDRLARFHAAFWSDPHLTDPCLGLCDATRLLDATSLAMAQNQAEPSRGVLPDWITDGWEVMGKLLEADVFAELRRLSKNPRPLIAALNRYPYTLLHGDYRAENMGHADQPVLIDWQLATFSLMTIDLAWFVKFAYVSNTLGQQTAIDYYRTRLETYLDRHFDDAEWQIMIDLGYFVDAVRSTCFSAYWSIHSDTPEGQLWEENVVKQRNQQVRAAIRWLV
jgi:hypothetical protein